MNRTILWILTACLSASVIQNSNAQEQSVTLDGNAGGKRFDGIGVVNGGGATSVLLKDYPEPQRSQILDLVYKPKFGASVSALLVEIPGDGNSTQGSMPSHQHIREDLNYSRGYTWWILKEAKKRNPNLTLDGAAWSTPGWIGGGNFWSQDAADYYVNWLKGLRDVYGLEFTAIGCRNEKGEDYDFVKRFRKTLDANGFSSVRIHAFDNWPKGKLDFVKDLFTDKELHDAVDIISGHVFYEGVPVSPEERSMAEKLGKPIWNTEDHVYKKGFDCLISLVECFNENYIRNGVTKIVNWYDIAGIYPLEPYAEDPPTVLAYEPWSGHFRVREALWGYAHYGQFSEVGWEYLNNACMELDDGGSLVTLKSPKGDYSIIIETKDAESSQILHFQLAGGLSEENLCVWHSNAQEQFIRLDDVIVKDGAFTLEVEPNTVYSLSTTTGQQKGSYPAPESRPFPFPYYETFEQYERPEQYGYLPRYTADISGAFEIADRPDGQGKCLHQVVPVPTISWAPDWKPYTIIGDSAWADYEVSADVYLNPGDAAGVMGRINDVGSGYGFIPKGYFLQLSDDGNCELVVVRGKIDKKALVGDAEQRALIKSGKDEGEGGEKILASVKLPAISSGKWYNLKLRFKGNDIIGFVDEKQVVKAEDTLYSHGMAGLLVEQYKDKVCTPYFDNLRITPVGKSVAQPTLTSVSQTPIYANAASYDYIEVAAPFPMPPIAVYKFPDKEFCITDYGAKRHGTDTYENCIRANMMAFKMAMRACNEAGGGRVVVPEGVWPSGPIHFESNCNLHLADSAVVRFSSNPGYYLPAVEVSWEGLECMNYSPLVYAYRCNNIAITGKGIFAPEMDTWQLWFKRPQAHLNALARLYDWGTFGEPVGNRLMAEGENHLRPHLIHFNQCCNIRLDGFKIRESPFWTIHMYRCNGGVVRNLDVYAHGHNNDGIDIEMTKNFLIENCTFDQGDDAVVIKAGRNHDAWRIGCPTENIVIRNCRVIHGHVLLGCGSEISGGIRNVYMHDCDMEGDVFRLFYLKTNRRRGAFIENIYMERVNANKMQRALAIDTDVLYQWKDLVPTYKDSVTLIRNIYMKDVKCKVVDGIYEINGDADLPVQNVNIENLEVDTILKYKERAKNVERLVTKNIRWKNFLGE